MVTANKALLAEDGAALHAAAAEAGADLYYEAAVAGAIPLLRPLRESLAGDRIPGSSASSTAPPTSSCPAWTRPAPASPRRSTRPPTLGYAEADPTADVEGFDAAAKAAILASLAFHTRVTAADVYREGITEVTAADVAQRRGDGLHDQAAGICERVRQRTAAIGHRPRAPGDDPAHPPAGRASATRSTRSSSRPRRPGS